MIVRYWAAAVARLTLLSGGRAGLGADRDLGELGTFHKWHKVEVVLAGPESSVTADPNPFEILVTVAFEGPGGTFKVPAFYDGDGRGGPSGNVWKARFSPNATGRWTFIASSGEPRLDGDHGSFTVDAAPGDAPAFFRWGRLQYAGGHYLKFADGGYWIKAGLDDPENFLGKPFGDWEGKKKIVDYLSGKGCNSIYVMTNTIAPGDEDDTWPWLGETPAAAKANSSRFDPARLARWDDFFAYCQMRNVVLHIVLLDDSAWHDFDHELYYREMIARFGYLPAIIWNIGEEAFEAYRKNEQQLELAALLRRLDPYRHPVTVHLGPDWPHMGSQDFDLTSIQTKPGGNSDFTTVTMPDLNAIVTTNRQASAAKGRPLAVMIDEAPGVNRVDEATRYKLRSAVLYPVFLGGGGFELHYRDQEMTPQALGPMLDDMRRARELVESLPFEQMAPRNELVSAAGGGLCLARPGAAYAIYLKDGGAAQLDLGGLAGAYQVKWFDVTRGTTAAGPVITGGGKRSLGTPPWSGDVACTVTPVADYFPPPDAQGGWRTPTSTEETRRIAGMDRQKLDEAFRIAEGSAKNGGLLVVRNGWLVYERYFGRGHREATPNLASCGKSFTSVAIGILMSERPELFPDGLDQRVFTPVYLPAEAFPLSDPAKADIRLGQLLAFTAGIRGNNPCFVNGAKVTIDPAGPDGYRSMIDAVALGRKDTTNDRGELISAATLWCQPGGGYSYASSSVHIASIIIRHVTGMELEEYVRTRMAEPMGWGRFGYGYRNAREVTHTPGAGGIAMRPTDVLRFGYMLLRQGRWSDRQIVPAEFVRRCGTESPYNPHYPYSLCFDVNTGGQIAEFPRDAYWKGGSGGHVIWVVPSLDLVVFNLAGRDEQYAEANTGLPAHPDAPDSDTRGNWKPTVRPEDAGPRQILRKVIESIVQPGPATE